MNERIRELAKSSDINIDNFWNDDYSNNRLEKFAELIIQDCIAQVALLGISNFENDDISWAVDMAIKNIQHRFGIEK